MQPLFRTRIAVPIAVFFLLAELSAPASWAAPRRLVAHDLGAFDGLETTGDALNDRGQLIGVALAGPGQVRSFLWDRGTMTDLGLGNSVAVDINDRGQILLQEYLGDPNGSNSCSLRDGDATIDLGSPDLTQCFAADLNNLGQAVGTMQVTAGSFHTSHAFLWDKGTMTRLGSLGGDYAIATAVNDRGQVVGGSTIGMLGEEHAFLWEAGTMTDLGAPGASWSVAYAINDRGQVVMTSGSHLYLWKAGSVTDLGQPGGSISYPMDINERGQILIAAYDDDARVFHYGIWERGTVTPLPSLGSGLPVATRLNNRGEVVGTDSTDAGGIPHLVLWTPTAPGRGHQ